MITVRRLVWDQGNIAHIARHKVTPQEVEEVCQSNPEVEEGYSGRLRFVGLTRKGSLLAVILAPKGEDVYYPVTARPASVKERKQFRSKRGGEI